MSKRQFLSLKSRLIEKLLDSYQALGSANFGVKDAIKSARPAAEVSIRFRINIITHEGPFSVHMQSTQDVKGDVDELSWFMHEATRRNRLEI